MKNKRLIIGSRASSLALAQAELVKGVLALAYSDLAIDIKTIKTTGDKILDLALNKIGGKGLFTKEIEEALLRREIDFAVHSMKDLPTELPRNLKIAAVTKREDPCDVLISGQGFNLKTLPQGAKIGTSSLRRRSQLLQLRNDLRVLDLRGNLETRVKKLEQGLYDAIILAYAGVKRLGLNLKITLITKDELLPQAGQGALGIEVRQDDQEAATLVKVLDDPDTHLCIDAERALLAGLGGGCQVPIGVYAHITESKIFIEAGVFSLDGKLSVKGSMSAEKNNASELGLELSNSLREKGAQKILNEVKIC